MFQLGAFSHGTGTFWQPAVSLAVIMEQHKLDLVFFTLLAIVRHLNKQCILKSVCRVFWMVNILQTWIETRLQYILKSDWYKPIPNVSCRLALIWLAEWMEFMGIIHCTRQIKTSSFSNKGEGRLHTGKPSTVFKALAM